MGKARTGPAQRRPRKVSRRYLENAALFYLGRYDAPARHLNLILERKVARSARAHGTDPAEGRAWAAEVVEKLISEGWLDDARYARNRARRLFNSGKSQRAIAADLAGRGVGRAEVEGALKSLDTGTDPDREAVWRLARRRKLGPFRTTQRAETRERDLGVLARAGFSYALARTVIDADESEPP